jgi:hypothetical protein
VVIMSDEFRTAACDLRRDTSGVSVFAKYQATGREQRVEVFYASAPGRAAAELDTVDCEGLFTRVLHDGLTGMLHNGLGAEASIR